MTVGAAMERQGVRQCRGLAWRLWGVGRSVPSAVSRLLAWVGGSDRPSRLGPDLLGLGRNGFGIGHLGFVQMGIGLGSNGHWVWA